MLDGTYEIATKTPLGTYNGTIVLVTEGQTCNADLSIAGKTAKLVGVLNGEEVTFEGTADLPFPLGKTDYTLVGTVVGDDLSGTFNSKRLKFDVTGKRVA